MYKLYYQGKNGEIRISKTGVPTAEDKTLSEVVADDIIAEGLIPGGKGEKGDKGDTGPQGPKGDKGDKGDTGPAGKSTQLYRHSVKILVMYDGNMYNTTCTFITLSDTSFTRKSYEVLNDGTYLSGVIDLAPLWGMEEEAGSINQIIAGIGSGSEEVLVAFDQDGNPMPIYFQEFGEDTVTAI